MTRRTAKKIVYFVCLAACVWVTAVAYGAGYRTIAAVAAVLYAIEAWWVWRRHFGRPVV
jgi:hypothetical protein